MIEPGLQRSREDWPKGVLSHLQQFRQGDVFEGFPVPYIGNPEVAVHQQTKAYSGFDSEMIGFGDDFPYGMILTQTCDIREEDSKIPRRPWILAAPVYNSETRYWDSISNKESSFLDGGIRKLLAVGGGPQYLLGLPDFVPSRGLWVADFRLVVSIEKGWLLDRNPIQAFVSEESRKRVGRQVASLLTRPAFDGRFEQAVRGPLVKSLSSLDSALCNAIYQEVENLAVEADNNVMMNRVRVWVLSRQSLSDEARQWFVEQNDLWHCIALDNGLNLLNIQFGVLQSMTADKYINLTMMPLSDITPEPPWYGVE